MLLIVFLGLDWFVFFGVTLGLCALAFADGFGGLSACWCLNFMLFIIVGCWVGWFCLCGPLWWFAWFYCLFVLLL